MTNNTKHLPNTITQTSGGKYQTFTNLNNIKTTTGYAQTGMIHGKTKPLNRPSTVTVSNFKASIPTGAIVTRISVTYKHSKVASSDNKTPNITAPTITLMKGNKSMKWGSGKDKGKPIQRKSKAPTTTAKEITHTFNSIWNYDEITASDFGIRLDYPTNTNENEGYIRLYYIKVTIEYKPANFTVNLRKGSGQYNHEEFEITATCNNPNLVKYTPNVTITAPPGFSLKEWGGTGKLTIINAGTYQWTPSLGRKRSSDDIHLVLTADITFPSGVETVPVTFMAVESLKQKNDTLTFNVGKTAPRDPSVDPVPPEEESTIPDEYAEPETPEIYTLAQRGEFTFDLDLPTSQYTQYTLYVCTVTAGNFDDYSLDTLSTVMKIYDPVGQSWSWQNYNKKNFDINPSDFTWDVSNFRIDTVGAYVLAITPRGSTEVIKAVYIDVKPEEPTRPNVTILELTQEELNRLGDGYTYTAQTWFKLNTSDGYVKDWNKNSRIAVFNNAIKDNITTIDIPTDDGYESIVYDTTDYDTLTKNDLFDHAEYWSPIIRTVEEFNNLEVEFPYNKNYPVYILIIGTWSDTITFTEPCIIEDYTTRLSNGIYPVPIDDLILNDGSTSDINIPQLSKSDTLVFYNLPLEDNYGTNEEIAIRGISINGNIEANTDNLILNATLVNANKESKNRSIVLDETDATLNPDNEFSIGQVGDLWGFHTYDIQNFEDWEIHLSLNNAVNDFDAHANFGNINLTVYMETVEQQNIKCYINGEDLSYYGVFITDVKIPQGLKTDTDYINVNGTDINDPFRQNIREKTIEVEFDIGDNCDLEGATLSLRQLTALLVNERDKYNRPIPNTVEFSHYPDVYWEYIMEDTLDAEIEISSYNAKAKLVIPAGTSYDKKVTRTNSTGFLSGLASIRPSIICKPTGSIITVSETLSEQEFNMSYDGDWIGKYIEIDCENRIVWLKEDDDDSDGVNITAYVDWNSDWFTIYGEYNFETVNCAILSVDWQERW